MGIKLERKKERNWLLTIIYRLHKILPFSSKRKLRLYLDIEWIFYRLAHEVSFQHYQANEHPLRIKSGASILAYIQKEDRVLDLGCKYGELSYLIADKAQKVIGIDFDKKAISKANKLYQKDNLEFKVGDARKFLEDSNYDFDVLILSHILEHLDNPLAFLKNFAAYFNRIYIEVPDFQKSYLNQYRKDLGNKLIYTDTDHVSEFDRDELKELIKSCGLKIINAEYIFGLQKVWCKKI